ncbi:MAG TPA: hypothetical protein VK864_09040, partial [Longimicrobiales bacterium]|nr:hypothetical protein [Longimicrobiales bacterium]
RNGTELTGAREDRGNAVLSTMELKAPHAIELPFERQRRVVAGARIEGRATSGSDWELTVMSVHLDNRSRLARVTASLGVARLRQAEALVETLEDDGNDPKVVAGDLNTWSLGWLERSIPHLSQALSDTPDPQPEITYVKGRIRRRIDYMFFEFPEGWHGRYERIDHMYGSDHFPLLGWVRFGEADTRAQ